MRASLKMSLLALLLTAGITHADTAAPRYKPLRPVNQCLRIEGIKDWHVLDARHATVASDRYYYRITLAADCPHIGLGATGLNFSANPSNRQLGDSRICGEAGETVRGSVQPPCAIESVAKISAAQYKQFNLKPKPKPTATGDKSP